MRSAATLKARPKAVKTSSRENFPKIYIVQPRLCDTVVAKK